MDNDTVLYIEKLKAAALADREPRKGSQNFRCEEGVDGSRPGCNPGLCCGAAQKEGAADETAIETC